MKRRWIEGVVISAVFASVVLVAIWGAGRIERETRAAAGKSLRTVLQATEQAIDLWVGSQIAEARGISERPSVRTAARELLTEYEQGAPLHDSVHLAALRRELRPRLTETGRLGFFVIAPDQTNVASMRDGNIGERNLIARHRPELWGRISNGASAIVPTIPSDVPLPRRSSGDSQWPTMFVAVPMLDSSGGVFAVFTLRLDPIDDFSRLTALGRIGASGETYAFDREGYMVSQSRFDDQLRRIGLLGGSEDSILNIRVVDPGVDLTSAEPTTDSDARPRTYMAARAQSGESGVNTSGYRDYRGVTVLGAWMWDDRLDIGLATEIEQAEILDLYYLARMVIVIAMSVGGGATALLVIYVAVARERLRRREEAAQTALERRVRARTSELVSINQDLRENVAERVRAEEQLKAAQAELEDSNRRLEELASEDGVTGIANRREFEARLLQEWRRCRREQRPLSLLLFDIDYFKRFNDTYGHQAGDECLAMIGRLLREGGFARRPGDLVARYGGEEFAIILSSANEAFARRTGERLCKEMRGLRIPHVNTGLEEIGVVTASVGAASMMPAAGLELSDLVAAADAALYRAKRGGRNRCMVARKGEVGGLSDASGDPAGRGAADRETGLEPPLRWRQGSVGRSAVVR